MKTTESNDETTRLNTLKLSNFRCFEDLAVNLHPELNVLVAVNGGGKTALLDAIAVSLRLLADNFAGMTNSRGFARSDIRLVRNVGGDMVPIIPTELLASGRIAGIDLAWKRTLGSLTGRTTTVHAKVLLERGNELFGATLAHAHDPQRPPPPLPLLAYYGTARLWSEGRQTSNRKASATRIRSQFDAYLDCLDPHSNFQSFALWFERVSREAQRQENSSGKRDLWPADAISAIRAATDQVLAPAGWAHLDWNFQHESVVAHHAETGELPVAMLSDGVRNTLALVADLAYRCVRLNPHHRAMAPLETSGIVLIDEIDMHLHPRWQQTILGSLQKAFPRIQFIVTTHSPQVLSTVPRECIRIIEQFEGTYRARIPEVQTKGVESAQVMLDVMQVDAVPDTQEVRDLRDLESMIADGDDETPAAKAIHEKLVAHFGEHHPVILDLEKYMRWEQFKRSREVS